MDRNALRRVSKLGRSESFESQFLSLPKLELFLNWSIVSFDLRGPNSPPEFFPALGRKAVDLNPRTNLISEALNMILQKFCSRRDCLALVMSPQSTGRRFKGSAPGLRRFRWSQSV